MKKFIVYAFPLFAMNFYSYSGFNHELSRIAFLLSIVLMLTLTIRDLFIVCDEITNKIRYIVFLTLFSMVMAFTTRGQEFSLCFRATAVFLVILYFFYISKRNVPISTLENLIIFYGFLYIFLWMYGVSKAPLVVFGTGKEAIGIEGNYYMDRGFVRVNFVGRIFMIASHFIFLNKYVVTRKSIYLIGTFVMLLFIMLQMTRQLFILPVIISSLYIYKIYKKRLIFVFPILLIASYFALVAFGDDSILGKYISFSMSEDNSFLDDIRFQEYRYYFTEYSDNIMQILLGNGQAHVTSVFGKFEMKAWDKSFFAEDVGYAKMFVVTGICGLLLYLFLFIKSLRYNMPSEYEYVKMFMWFLVFANIGASWYSSADCQICMSIMFFIMIKQGVLNKKMQK